MFSLVSSRYERTSLIVTSNRPVSAWGEIFGATVAAAVHEPQTGSIFDRLDSRGAQGRTHSAPSMVPSSVAVTRLAQTSRTKAAP